MKGFRFLEEVETPRGKGLVIGRLDSRRAPGSGDNAEHCHQEGERLLVAVRREGEKGPGRNVTFGWCEVHGVYEVGEECGCQRMATKSVALTD